MINPTVASNKCERDIFLGYNNSPHLPNPT
jgi:hypothetical protein